MQQDGLGPPPVAYAVLVLGSAGRGESQLAADQDNAIVYAEGGESGPQDAYFEKLAIHMSDILDAAGVPDLFAPVPPQQVGGLLGNAEPLATLEARGASAEATALRQEAARATRTLFDGTALGPDLLEDLPAPPGVVAHMAPNEAVREGFRQRRDGSFFTPLTSIQRWLAARNGWRLHVVATAPCRASVVVGDDARHVRVHASRAADGGWEVGIEGTAPPMTLRLAAAEKVGVSVVADAAGGVRARAGDAERTSVVDVAAAPPQPPYGLHFSEGPGPGGCQVVWLEIPFPWDAAVARAWVLDPGPLASR